MLLVDSSDRFKCKIEDAVFTLSTIEYEKSKEIAECTFIEAGEQRQDIVKAMKLTMKYSIRGIEGVQGMDGKPYPFKWDESGYLEDKHVNIIFNNSVADKLYVAINAVKRGDLGKVETANGDELDIEVEYLGKSEALG